MIGCANSSLMTYASLRATSVVIHPDQLAPEALHTRNARNSLPGFCAGLSVSKNITVRLSNEEREDNPDE